ncbi:PP0621 family protein [Pseudomonas huanghezhanensis]|uniref:PP0621 family protein n=1 Tax=Pseudomonas huanghezhanensis TaxID=3002903 RepID=UPI0022857A65|nr:PP0621 family protein [Pseudomonas sp. BSw22131]
MIRLIMWIALIMATIWFFKRLVRGTVSRAKSQPPELAAAPMVRCAQCGVHVPQDRALSSGQQWYCSEPHRLQGPATRER